MSWVPLHVHSQYSILESTASIASLVQRAVEIQTPAIALTDLGNLFGAVEFFKTCSSAGIKPIIGCELIVATGSCRDKKKNERGDVGHPIVLLVKNKTGYRNLCKLASLAYLEGFYYTPRIDFELLKEHSEGLICVTGSVDSKLGATILRDPFDLAIHEALFLQSLFGDDLYFQVQRLQMAEKDILQDGFKQETWLYQGYQDLIQKQNKVEHAIIELSLKHGIRTLATHEVFYLHKEDWLAQEIIMNVQSGEPREIWEKDAFGQAKSKMLNPKRRVKFSHEYYFRDTNEIKSRFADYPQFVNETLEVVKKCDFMMDFKAKFYPVFTPPALDNKVYTKEVREQETNTYLRELCEEGLSLRYTAEALIHVEKIYPGKDPLIVVRERLDYELNIITSKGMCDYLLIVHDFISWAKKQGIPVGPGRGSGAGSIILYLIGVTDIEPLRFHLFFERFINPERISYPDIDVDICMDRRPEVIAYTMRKYGRDKVAQIITFGTMKAKMAIKDVGRVLNVPLVKVNALAKLIPEDPNMTIEKALEMDLELRKFCEEDEEIGRIIELAKKVEGSIRNTGIHAAGLIICGDNLTDHIPLCTSKDAEMLVTQYSMKPVESVGMLKIDFLGLKTLTSIQKTVEFIKERQNISVDWMTLPLDNIQAFSLLNQGKTSGVFQLESAGMQELAKQLHIDRFEEIIAVGALYRPGPMEMIPSFIQRKHGREQIENDHPHIQDILQETYGIMVYQEQVMQIASRLANYSLGEGDVLRRAMGKKDKDEMAGQREKFKSGAVLNGVSEEVAIKIFDKIEKFASYGFNKSHAAAYGYLSYVTAYLKANYPVEWMAALMTCDMDDLSKVAKHIRECQDMNIAILAPDINESGSTFTATDRGIRFALSGIKGIGEGVVQEIIQKRRVQGVFKTLYDFLFSIDPKKVGRKAVEVLVETGCFDSMKIARAKLRQMVDPLADMIADEQKEAEKGILDFFAKDKKVLIEEILAKLPEPQELSPQDIFIKEKQLLGFYLTGHPMDAYKETINTLSCLSFAEIEQLEHPAACKIAFTIENVTTRISKMQRKFAILTISDGEECLELPIWPDSYEQYHHNLTENQLLVAVVQTEKENDVLKLRARWLGKLSDVNDEMITIIQMHLDKASHFVQLDANKNNKSGDAKKITPEKKKENMEKQLRLKMEVDAENLRLSHILTLKKLFLGHPGHIGIHIEIVTKNGILATLSIQDEWGVRFDGGLEQLLQRLPFIRSLKLISG